jgi:hypothetical protein
VVLQLDPPGEGRVPMMLFANLPVPVAPSPAPSATPIPGPAAIAPEPGPLDDDTRRELAEERRQLAALIEREKDQVASAIEESTLRSQAGNPPPPHNARGGIGTVRELDLSGRSQAVIDLIMTRYGLSIEQRYLTGPSNQTFLSSAATSQGGKYFASRDSRPGVYEVFELSRRAVAKMSKLEEEEIRRRGLELDRTCVTGVRFGIVEIRPGEFDLGILDFQAEPVR